MTDAAALIQHQRPHVGGGMRSAGRATTVKSSKSNTGDRVGLASLAFPARRSRLVVDTLIRVRGLQVKFVDDALEAFLLAFD